MSKYNVQQGRRKINGFTLIELMIVIAIVAILVALAVPAFKDYTVRAKVVECLGAAAVPKLQISEFHQVIGRWPSDSTEAGIDSSLTAGLPGISHYCSLFSYINNEGDFTIWVDTAAIDPSLASVQIVPALSPTLNATGTVDWHCTLGFTDAEALKYLPSSCRVDNLF